MYFKGWSFWNCIISVLYYFCGHILAELLQDIEADSLYSILSNFKNPQGMLRSHFYMLLERYIRSIGYICCVWRKQVYGLQRITIIEKAWGTIGNPIFCFIKACRRKIQFPMKRIIYLELWICHFHPSLHINAYLNSFVTLPSLQTNSLMEVTVLEFKIKFTCNKLDLTLMTKLLHLVLERSFTSQSNYESVHSIGGHLIRTRKWTV